MNTQERIQTTFYSLAAVLALTVGGASRADATCIQRSSGNLGSPHSFSIGNSDVGVYGGFAAGASLSSPDCPGDPSALAKAEADATVKLFGLRYSLFGAEAEASNTSAGSNVILRVEIGPKTLVNVDNPHHLSWSTNYPIQLIPPKSKNFIVYGVPVQLTISAGAGIAANLTLQPAYPVQLNGQIRTWATGNAGAYINAAILRAGVRATLNLLNTTLASSVELRQSGASGSVVLYFEPVTIYVRLVVDRRSCYRSGWRIKCSWKEVAGKTIVDYSPARYTKTLVSF